MKAPSISVNKETIGLVMGVVAICSTLFTVYNWLLEGRPENSPMVRELVTTFISEKKDQEKKDQEQDTRLDRTDRDRERGIKTTQELTVKTDELKEAVVRLTTVLENNTVTKKAEYAPFAMPSATPQAISLEAVR